MGDEPVADAGGHDDRPEERTEGAEEHRHHDVPSLGLADPTEFSEPEVGDAAPTEHEAEHVHGQDDPSDHGTRGSGGPSAGRKNWRRYAAVRSAASSR